MQKKYYRLPIVLVALSLLVHSSFSYYDIGSCAIYDTGVYNVLVCKFKFLVRILIVVALFVLNEMFIYKITKNSFPRWLIVSTLFLVMGSGLMLFVIWLSDEYGHVSGDAGVMMSGLIISVYSTVVLILTSVYLFRLLIQRLFANFFRRFYYFISTVVNKLSFLFLERYFYSSIIIVISISVLLYIVTFISLTSV